MKRKFKHGKTFAVTTVSLMLLSLLFILALMLWPLYDGIFTTGTSEERHFYVTIDGEEVDYIKFEGLTTDSFIMPFIKGEKLEVVEKSGRYDVYRWKIAPDSNTDYLIFERIDKITEYKEGMIPIDFSSYTGSPDARMIYIAKRVESNDE